MMTWPGSSWRRSARGPVPDEGTTASCVSGAASGDVGAPSDGDAPHGAGQAVQACAGGAAVAPPSRPVALPTIWTPPRVTGLVVRVGMSQGELCTAVVDALCRRFSGQDMSVKSQKCIRAAVSFMVRNCGDDILDWNETRTDEVFAEAQDNDSPRRSALRTHLVYLRILQEFALSLPNEVMDRVREAFDGRELHPFVAPTLRIRHVRDDGYSLVLAFTDAELTSLVDFLVALMEDCRAEGYRGALVAGRALSMVSTQYAYYLRPAENAGILIPDIDFLHRDCPGKGLVIRNGKADHGSGPRPRRIDPPLVPDIDEIVLDYLANVRPHFKGAERSSQLYLSERGAPAQPDTLGQLIRVWRQATKARRELHAHGIRHTAITNAIRQGIPEVAVCRLAGQKSIGITRHYSHLSDDELRAMMRRALAA